MSKASSPALTLIQHVWDHNREATGFSWTRLNGSMSSAVMLAIDAGLRFDRDDFTFIAAKMRIGYWSGSDSGEAWYRRAVELDHPSAYQSYEAWRGRRPFILDGQRLHVGCNFQWSPKLGKERIANWQVTSFATDQLSVIAVQYGFPNDPEGGRLKVARRCKITRADIYAFNAAVRGLKAVAAERQRKVEELTGLAAHGMRWFKVLMNGRSFHGGDLEWSLPTKKADGWVPGKWHEVRDASGMGTPELCVTGLHITKLPVAWYSPGAEVYEVEIPEGARLAGDHVKSATLRCRLIRLIEGDELRELGIAPARSEASRA